MSATLGPGAGDCAGCPRETVCRALRDASLHLEAFGRVCDGSAAGIAAEASRGIASPQVRRPSEGFP